MKFRVWSNETKEYLNAYMDDLVLTANGHLCEVQEGKFHLEYNPLDPRFFIVEFFSGFRDISGQDIYQNDIVELSSEEEDFKLDDKGIFESLLFNPPSQTQEGDISRVCFDETGGFYLTIEPETSLYAFRLKVIGNINQTPELWED
jgi:hypothetical protein